MNIREKLKRIITGNTEKKAIAPVATDGMVSVTPDVILDTTKRLIGVNQGIPADERDSIRYRQVMSPDKLLAERIQMDAKNLGKTLMNKLSRRRTLKPVIPGYFDGYINSFLVGGSLSAPLEEVNPIHLLEQQRRITQMGEGGLSSDDMVTAEAQSVHPHEFGFVDVIAGPESSRIGVDTRAAWGAKLGDDGQIYQRVFNRKEKKYQWVSPKDLDDKVVGFPD